MKTKRKKDQQQTNQEVEVKGNMPSGSSQQDAMIGMPAEEKETKKVISQNRYLTYSVEEKREENKNSPEKSGEDVKNEEQSSSSQGIDEIEKLSQESIQELNDGNTVNSINAAGANQENPSESQAVESARGKYNAEAKAIQSFAQVLINHLETVDIGNWEKPWIGGNDLRWPRNLDGREYAASNALILLMHTHQNDYNTAIYATFDRIRKLNYASGNKDERLKDAEGNPLPLVRVKEGEQSMPVTKTLYTVVHRETKERIPFTDYVKLSDSEKKEYNVFPKSLVYRVFNIDQTNLKEARSELYEKLTMRDDKEQLCIKRDKDVSFPAVDAMLMKNLWQCPITIEYGRSAYYHKGKDHIYLPEKRQFKYPEAYYGTLFHECAHSTGSPDRYNRDMGDNDTKKYAREELVAELTAALVSSRYGLVKHVKSDSLPYLKAWLKALKEEPEFIKQLLTDVRKASAQIIRRVDLLQRRVEELRNMGVPQPEHYPDFLDVDPESNQPVEDPLRYPKKEDKEDKDEAQEQVKVGRGRR